MIGLKILKIKILNSYCDLTKFQKITEFLNLERNY